MLKLNLFIFLFLTIFFNSPLKASILCTNKNSKLESFNKRPFLIEIDVNKSRKWNMKALKILISKDLRIQKKNKKNFKAKVKVHYENNVCFHDAKLRITGDYKDHIFKKNGMIMSSMKIKLLESNINGAVSFKLFNPISRNSENEVFFTSLLRNLNYIAPKTMFVDVVFNGEKMRMLFQEDIRKEMLEGMGRIEGPMLEGDETLLKDIFDNGHKPDCEKSSCLRELVLTKLKNKKFFLKNNVSISNSLKAFNAGQRVYLDLNWSQRNTILNYNLLTVNKLVKSKWRIYDILLISSGATHALLSRENRTFYWDMFKSNFEPIYYDGNVEPTYYNLFRFINKNDFAYIYKNIKEDDFNQSIKIISQINTKLFFENLFKLGLNEKEIEKSKKLLNMIITNLKDFKLRVAKYAKGTDDDDTNIVAAKNSDLNDSKKIEKYINNKNKLFSKMPHIFIKKNDNLNSFDSLKVGSFSKWPILECVSNVCSNKNILGSELADILQRNNIKSGGIVLKSQKQEVVGFHKLKLNHNNQPIFIIHSTGVTFDWNNVNNKLKINAPKKSSWVVIENSLLKEVDIVFHGGNQNDIDQSNISRFNNYGITGSLNIYNSNLENVKIKVFNSFMEDSINIRNSSGSISDIEVKSAKSDAIDFDFSQLAVNNIIVDTAGNDCLDLSYGNYSFNRINAYNCKDKGVSVGENSSAIIQEINIDTFYLGVVSKDSSSVEIKKMFVTNLKNNEKQQKGRCADVYNKKQEFFGGYLKISEHNCDKEDFHKDEFSELVVIF